VDDQYNVHVHVNTNQNKKAKHKMASWAYVIDKTPKKHIVWESLHRVFSVRGGIFLGQ